MLALAASACVGTNPYWDAPLEEGTTSENFADDGESSSDGADESGSDDGDIADDLDTTGAAPWSCESPKQARCGGDCRDVETDKHACGPDCVDCTAEHGKRAKCRRGVCEPRDDDDDDDD